MQFPLPLFLPVAPHILSHLDPLPFGLSLEKIRFLGEKQQNMMNKKK